MQKKLFQKTLSICLALSIMIGLLPQIPVLAAEDALRICVISDTHYYPLTYVSDCEDYQTYVNGDPKMLAESGSCRFVKHLVQREIQRKQQVVLSERASREGA